MITVNNKVYVTYFDSKKEFEPKKIQTNLNCRLLKPECAFWGSPVNAEFGWRDWCKIEKFDYIKYDFNKPIYWKLKDGAKILNIDNNAIYDQNSILYKYVKNNEWEKKLDFQKMRNDGIDAVELIDISFDKPLFLDDLEAIYNLWGCQSIVVLDPTKIIFIDKSEIN